MTITIPSYVKTCRMNPDLALTFDQLETLIAQLDEVYKYLYKLRWTYKSSVFEKEPELKLSTDTYLHDISAMLRNHLRPASKLKESDKAQTLILSAIYDMYLRAGKDGLWYLVHMGNLLMIILQGHK